MMRYAQIVAGRVHGMYEYDPLPEFAPNIVMIPLPEGSPVASGWAYEGGEFSAPEAAPNAWPEAIAARRYLAEISGITINGMHVVTDDRSKLLINGAALEAMIDPEYVMQWKTPTGFVELNAAQVLGVARAVRAHVQACFDREAALIAAVADGSITDQMVWEGWP